MKKILVDLDNFFYKKILRNLLKMSKLGHGFVVTGAESGVNYEHIYNNRSEGKYFIGKVVDRALLNLPAVQATRGRKNDLKKVILNEHLNNLAQGKITRILDLASGGARYLREFREEHKQGCMESICIDKSLDNVRFGKKLVRNEGLENIKFFRGDIFSLRLLKDFSKKINWSPNMVIASGIFIYFNDVSVEKLIEEIYQFLPDGGCLIFTSYEKLNTRKLMRKAMQTSSGDEWTLYYRKPDYWRRLLYSVGFKNPTILKDKWEMNNVCFAHK